MLEPGRPLPSREEAIKETARRLSTLEQILPSLQTFADAIVLCGSLAYGKDHSVREASDIDLLILVEPEKAASILDSRLFPSDEWTTYAVEVFKNDIVQHFSLRQEINGVKVEYHFWDKEQEYRASRLEIESVQRLTRIPQTSPDVKYDFFGTRHALLRHPQVFGQGYLQQYPVFDLVNNHLVTHQPLNNLILAPQVLFTNDQTIFTNIDTLWRKLAIRLSEECDECVDLRVASIPNSQPGFVNATAHVQHALRERTKQELYAIGATITHDF